MHSAGWSIHGLARHFQMGRNRVRRILRKNESKRDEGHDILAEKKRAPRESKLDSYRSFIESELKEFPDITGVRLYEKLQDKGFDGGKTIVTDLLRKIRPRPKKEPVVRFETAPGVQGQMDWSPYTIDFTRTGKTKVLCFSYLLGFSRRHYIDFTMDRKFFTMIRRHRDAFEYFGGTPLTCLYDGEKTVILRWEGGVPVYNPAFVEFITHYQCRPVACRRGRPETKGKVERPFYYVELNFFNGRKFQDFDDLRARARWWLTNRSDVHIHETTRRPPLELFLEKEKRALLPLPDHPYDASEVVLRVCRMDGFLEHDTNLYSVPYDYVADILTLKATENEIFIYSPHLELITSHERLPYGARDESTNPDHRMSKKIRYGLEPVKEAFLGLGPNASTFLDGLKEKYPRNSGFHARYILQLKENYLVDDIDRCLSHATKYYAFDGKAVERVLKARAKPRTLESFRNARAKKTLGEALPEIRQRSLDEYCRLLSNEEE